MKRRKRRFLFGCLSRKKDINQNDSVLETVKPRTKQSSPEVKKDKNNKTEVGELQNRIESTNSQKRTPVYELFNTNEDKTNQKDVNTNREDSRAKTNTTVDDLNVSKNLGSSELESEDSDMFTELRLKEGLTRVGERPQRHSLQTDIVPRQGRVLFGGGLPRRSESMYAYVPRAVSLLNTSELLCGNDKDNSNIPYTNMGLHKFAPFPTSEERNIFTREKTNKNKQSQEQTKRNTKENKTRFLGNHTRIYSSEINISSGFTNDTNIALNESKARVKNNERENNNYKQSNNILSSDKKENDNAIIKSLNFHEKEKNNNQNEESEKETDLSFLVNNFDKLNNNDTTFGNNPLSHDSKVLQNIFSTTGEVLY